jgi:hypothetical protein
VYPDLKVPNKEIVLKRGALQQGSRCIDTMGRNDYHVAQMFTCHGTGGNQVCMLQMTSYKVTRSNTGEVTSKYWHLIHCINWVEVQVHILRLVPELLLSIKILTF